jgi:hypothetical protein
MQRAASRGHFQDAQTEARRAVRLGRVPTFGHRPAAQPAGARRAGAGRRGEVRLAGPRGHSAPWRPLVLAPLPCPVPSYP